MNQSEYQRNLHTAYLVANLLLLLPIDQMLVAANRSQMLAPFLDPTLFQQKGRSLAEDITILEALREARIKLHKLAFAK